MTEPLPTHETVLGPLDGYFVALYACPIERPAGAYLGFYKVCLRKPDSYFGADSLLSGCCETGGGSVERAMAMARQQAEDKIRLLPIADGDGISPTQSRFGSWLNSLLRRRSGGVAHLT